MAKFTGSDKSDTPPQWLQPYMGKRWKPLTLAQWYGILVDAGFITPRAGGEMANAPASNPGI